MSVPSYSLSVIANFRREFLQLHKKEFPGSDEDLWKIINDNQGSDSEETMEWVLQAMEEVL